MRDVVVDRVGRLAAAACAVAALSGCIAVSSHPDYPVDWAQPDKASLGSCPRLAGTYVDAGELAEACTVNPSEWKDTGLWGCNTSLARNLGLDVAAERVSIEQPDEQTLVVVAHPASGEPKRFVLGRGDRKFACDETGLAVSKIGSGLPWWANVAAPITLTAHVSRHGRSFRRAADGSLVMTVQESEVGYHILFGFSSSSTYHVRWPPALLPTRPPPEDAGGQAPAGSGDAGGDVAK